MSKAPLIAIVDDDVMVCEAMQDLIETFGFHAHTFTSAAEFLNSDCVHDTSCLIADVQMPGTNGLQLLCNLVASGRHIPVIFITAFPDERVRQRQANRYPGLRELDRQDRLVGRLVRLICRRRPLSSLRGRVLLRVRPQASSAVDQRREPVANG
jgi:CheY-like chemotaxis protein